MQGRGVKITESDSDKLNLKLLLNNRIDIFPLEKNVAHYLIYNLYPDKTHLLTYNPTPIAKTNLAIAFPKSNPESDKLRQKFNQGLKKFQKTAKYEELLAPNNQIPKIKVAYAHFPPWKEIRADQFNGIDAEILREAGRRLGLQMEFIECPWKRCIEMVQTGAVDLITSFGKSDQREEFTYYLGSSYAHDSVVFYKNKNSSASVNTYEDLNQYSIGVTKGSTYFDRFDKDPTLNRTSVTQAKQLMEMLRSSRLELIIGYEKVMDYLLTKQGYTNELAKERFSVPSVPSYFAMSKKSRSLFTRNPWPTQLSR